MHIFLLSTRGGSITLWNQLAEILLKRESGGSSAIGLHIASKSSTISTFLTQILLLPV